MSYVCQVMMGFILVLLLVAAVQGNVVKRSDDAVCAGPTQLSPEQIQDALDAHNAFRSTAGDGDAANVVKMRWSDDLASRAQDWANKCEFVHQLHTLCDGVTGVGQNLYMGSASLGINVTEFIKLWNDEKKDYTYSDGSCDDVCGHYTQVVWAKSVEVGCAVNHCDNLDYVCNLKSKNAIVFACNYSPGGNVWGQKPYVEGPPCSDCGSVIEGGGYKCEDNLCVECMPRDDPDCQCAETLECENGGSWFDDTCECICNIGSFYGESCEHKCECVDNSPYCYQWTQYCSNPPYRTFMTENCGATCDLCDLPDTCN